MPEENSNAESAIHQQGAIQDGAVSRKIDLEIDVTKLQPDGARLPFSVRERSLIRRALAHYLKEHAPREGSVMNLSKCADTISRHMNYNITRPLLEGFIYDTRDTNEDAIHQIRAFLIRAQPSMGIQNYDNRYSPTKNLAINLQTFISSSIPSGDAAALGSLEDKHGNKIVIETDGNGQGVSRCNITLSPNGVASGVASELSKLSLDLCGHVFFSEGYFVGYFCDVKTPESLYLGTIRKLLKCWNLSILTIAGELVSSNFELINYTMADQ